MSSEGDDAVIEAKPGLRKYDGETITHVMPQGTYVIGTKYDDGDPGDAWGVGYYLESFQVPGGEIRHRIIGNDGTYLYGPKGFKVVRAGLDPDVGRWLVENCAVLEKSPPGSINLWGMLTDLAFSVRDRAETGSAGIGESESPDSQSP
jgi:hypothetical protein